jgi:hypothetical protein
VEISQNFVAFSEYMNFKIPNEKKQNLIPSRTKNDEIHHCARPSPFATARPPAATVPFAPQIPVNLPPPPQVAAKFNPE